MFAKLIAKFGRRIVMWVVVAVAGAAARKAMEAWAQRGAEPGAGASTAA
jgi:hypothetical protein